MKKWKYALLILSLVLIGFGLSGIIAGAARTHTDSYMSTKQTYEEYRDDLEYYEAIQLCISFTRGGHPEETVNSKEKYPDLENAMRYYSASAEREEELSSLIKSTRDYRNEWSNELRDIERSGVDAVTNGSLILTAGVILLIVFIILAAREYKMDPAQKNKA